MKKVCLGHRNGLASGVSNKRMMDIGGNVKERTVALNEIKEICNKQGIIEYKEGGVYSMEPFYKQTKANIAWDLVAVIGIVVGSVLLIGGAFGLAFFVINRKRKKPYLVAENAANN